MAVTKFSFLFWKCMQTTDFFLSSWLLMKNKCLYCILLFSFLLLFLLSQVLDYSSLLQPYRISMYFLCLLFLYYYFLSFIFINYIVVFVFDPYISNMSKKIYISVFIFYLSFFWCLLLYYNSYIINKESRWASFACLELTPPWSPHPLPSYRHIG